ncbi:MAG: DUF3293 domain-containing protein [Candidatus Thiothrix putei]|uniref:DUF3293 domain-containing protein n=2 Tax=Thiothrix TaxID=1030 RepID=A0A1H4A378_9GAMM|nr:DUF3293 domain-containing protein [Thiothrix caldifontis]WGZ92413.1 MAG: DUF3293 domain-containing protein [Candidatus Thiothrix putei]SEA30465.1 Protein of unknown function [Thiothrix caldifontis]
MMTSELLAAYHAAHYQVQDPQGAFTLRTDSPSPELAALLRTRGHNCAAFITACNPHSWPLSEAENASAQQQLAAELAQYGYTTIPAIGLDPAGEWQGEASFLVPGLDLENAKSLGEQYAQNAILWADAETAVPQLVVLAG